MYIILISRIYTIYKIAKVQLFIEILSDSNHQLANSIFLSD